VSWVDDNNITTNVADGIQPAVLPTVTTCSYDITNAMECSNAAVRINYYTTGKITDKSIGLCNVRLTGEVIGLSSTTGINLMPTPSLKSNGICYDLQGRRVVHPTKGLYIIGGKKIVIR
jgi:hypothetical protein